MWDAVGIEYNRILLFSIIISSFGPISVSTRKIGKYEIIERMGRGGMAEVYRAYQNSLDRYVAIKVLHAFLADDPEFKSRFEREAQNIAKLKHPNIVQVYDFEYDTEAESYYMVMELIDGVTLKDRINQFTERGELFPMKETIRIVREAASALAYAHSRSMIHRDVKPANLMFDHDDRVVLTDFGIAKIVTGAQFTASGGMVGTPAYMAPEQGLGQAGDERSDLYSLGIILFQLMAGRLPYDADTPLAIILKHLNSPTPMARGFNPALPEFVEPFIQKAIAKDASDRYQTANQFIEDLDQLEQQLFGPPPGGNNLLPANPIDDLSTHPDKRRWTDTVRIAPSNEPSIPILELESKTLPKVEMPPKPSLNIWRLFVFFLVALIVGLVTAGLVTGIIRIVPLDSTPTVDAQVAVNASETALSLAAVTDEPSPTPEPTTALPSATDTATLTTTATLSPSFSPTLTQTDTHTPTHTRTASPTPTPTFTATYTLTLTATAVPLPQAEVRQNVLIRSGPGNQYSRIGDTRAGDTLTISGVSEDQLWLRVSLANGLTGWVQIEAMRVIESIARVPTVIAPTFTATFTPTLMPTPNLTATLGAATQSSLDQTATTMACRWSYAIFAQDPEDGTDVAVNRPYRREITLQNTGTCGWEIGTALVFRPGSGEDFGAGPRVFLQETTPPGQMGRFVLEGRTPARGGGGTPLQGIWELRTPGQIQIGEPLTISVNVFG